MLRIRIAEDQDFNSEVISYLREFAIVDVQGCEQNEVRQILQNYDVFWFRLGFRIGEDQLDDNIRCKILATPVTGIDHIDESACESKGVKIVCLRGERDFLKKVRATAELTIALTLDLLRKTGPAQLDVQSGLWRRDLFRGREIFEKKVGIVGYGRLGAITASIFEALGAEIFYTEPREIEANSRHIKLDSIADLIQTCDIISLHVNYTPETKHLLNADLLQKFTREKYFINTSRGGLVDEKALLNQLLNKDLGGAALDVVQDEHKWDEKHPLKSYAEENDNLIITPHIGGNTYESFEKTEWFIAQRINKLLNND